MKKSDVFLKEYVTHLSDEPLKMLQNRLHFRFTGDLADVLNFLAQNLSMDKYLSGTESADELYEVFDSLEDFSYRECKKRFGEEYTP